MKVYIHYDKTNIATAGYIPMKVSIKQLFILIQLQNGINLEFYFNFAQILIDVNDAKKNIHSHFKFYLSQIAKIAPICTGHTEQTNANFVYWTTHPKLL